MAVLLLRIQAHLQSWGEKSRFSERDTGRFPTKSGVLGFVCCALGKPRKENLDDGFPTLKELNSLRMGIRIDIPGKIVRDFQTIGCGTFNGEKYGVYSADGKEAQKQVLSNRYYLSEAMFLVGLEGDLKLLNRIRRAISSPKWVMFLGRKACLPDSIIALPNSLLSSKSLEEALEEYPWLMRLHEEIIGTRYQKPIPSFVKFVVECGPRTPNAMLRYDAPLSFDHKNRKFGVRFIKEYRKPLKEEETNVVLV